MLDRTVIFLKQNEGMLYSCLLVYLLTVGSLFTTVAECFGGHLQRSRRNLSRGRLIPRWNN